MIAEHPVPGLYPGIPASEYHRWPLASNSRLSRLRRSPAHLKAYTDEPPADTTALALGRAAHAAILEPFDFDADYTVAGQCEAVKKGDGLRCANGGVICDASQGWLCGVHGKGAVPVPGRHVLPAGEFAACERMRDAVRDHAAASKLLAGAGEVELSVVWESFGVMCKVRLDRLSPDIAGGAVVDVKTTRDASPREFERSIFAHGYHRQGALYLDALHAHGIPAEHFVIIAVEKEPPFAVAVYRLTEGAIDAGREQVRPLLERYGECLERNEWPAYPDTVQDIALPDWSWAQIDAEASVRTAA
jgi:hypothetical protein